MPILEDDSISSARCERLNHKAHRSNSGSVTSSDNSNANKELQDTQKSLREALAVNRELQSKLLSELERIALRKRDNRLEAERCIERSSAVVLAGETTGSLTNPPSTKTPAESGAKHESTENEDGTKNDSDSNGKKERTKKKRKKSVKGDIDYIPTNDDINELLAADGNSNRDEDNDNDDKTEVDKNGLGKVQDDSKTKNKWSLFLRKKFRYDSYRKWTSEYFIDPTGSRPKENEDTVRRRKLMMKRKKKSSTISDHQQEKDELVPDTFFYHTSQPFTRQEKARLDKWLLQSNHNDDSDSFYERIAQKLREEHHENRVARKKDKVLLPTCVPRTAEEIRLCHQHRLASQYEFTKEESLAILEGVEETATAELAQIYTIQEQDSEDSTQINEDLNKESNKDRVQNEGIMRPDWQRICNRVLEVHRRSHSGHTNPSRQQEIPITPYQCMVHYKRNLRAQPDGSFTPEEDELLLRYIAAMGPQFVWGYPEINDLANRLFPYKSSRRIYERTLFSQWHPLSKDTIWTKEEEQKLVLAMKIYSETGSIGNSGSGGVSTIDDDSKDGGEAISEEKRAQNKQMARIASEKTALRRAAAHFHPYRQSFKVAKKWERSFSPRFSYKPFSKEEDNKLLAVVRSSAVTTPFSEIAKKHFPDRSSDQLSQRWTKIAPDKDVVKKYVPSMVRRGLKRGLLSTKSGSNAASTGEVLNSEGSHNNDSIQNSSGAIFDPSDFIVEVLENVPKGGQTKGESE